MPRSTYIHKDARQAMGFKDRLTLVLCGNAAGHMIKPGVIYRACTPRPLKNKSKDSFPVFWQHNGKAWMTAILFLEWLRQCFIPEVKSYLRAKGLPFKASSLSTTPGPPPGCLRR
uniref:DDE-1 domain-containing protein n=1 Tax=Trichuris muris TaxID=70415 RepID=A0A5S6QDI0_TRIMR